MTLYREADGRWFGESPIPGVMAYGASKAEARRNTIALAQRVAADRREHGECPNCGNWACRKHGCQAPPLKPAKPKE